ncbi:MAG: MucR family transcriptional regulator [bacterium]
MPKGLVEMAAEIVTAQASKTNMNAEEINDSLRKLYVTLKDIRDEETLLTGAAEGREGEKPCIEPGSSIQRNKIICCECGKEFKQLSKSHLRSHGLTPKEYKKKYGIPGGQALTAKSLTAKRRKLAKEMKLGSKLAEYRMKRSQKKKA